MSANLIDIEFTKTYASAETAKKVVDAKYKDHELHLRYMIVPVQSSQGLRYGVLFVGEKALIARVPMHFNVVV